MDLIVNNAGVSSAGRVGELSAMASVDRGDLYGLPMADADGRWFWRLKRTALELFNKLSGRYGRRIFR